MDDRDDRSEGSLQETTAHLNDGLKACSKVVASYRAMLTNEPDAADTLDTEPPPPSEPA